MSADGGDARRVVLVTGAAGTLGRPLVERLSGGCTVVALDARPLPFGAPVRSVRAELGGPLPAAVARELADVTHLVHLAASVDPSPAPPNGSWTDLHRLTVDALASLLDALPSLRHVTFASSYMVYAPASGTPVDESHALEPPNPYAWGKAALEDVLRDAVPAAAILRLTGVYGPGVPLEAGRSVMRIVSAALAGEPVRLHGDGAGGRRNHLYVSDAVDAFARAVAAEWSGTYNAGGPDAPSLQELIELAGAAAGRPVEVEWTPGQRGADVVVATKRLERETGFRASTTAAEGLREYVRWAREAA